jgi:hypothetical protein
MMTLLGFLAVVVWQPHPVGKPGSVSSPVKWRSVHRRSEKVQNTDNLKKAIDSNNRDFQYVPFDVKTTSDPDFLGMVIEYK